ncbi:MAG: putative DNA binding domain-containing protein [Thermotogae bacterium]|nr:putative DNA binding domain-containing protein [Thermotogota bacterium]
MPENQNIEYKESWRDEYIKVICGFANAFGGSVFIGLNDKGEIVGIKNSKKLMEDIPNKVRDTLGILVDVSLNISDDSDNKEYLQILVNSSNSPISYKGQYYYRTGSTMQILKGEYLNQFLMKKIGKTWDDFSIEGIEINNFFNDSFIIFKEESFLSKRIDEKYLNYTKEQLLNSLNLLDNKNNINNAGILLFHQTPERWIPGAYIKIGYFENDSDLRYQDEIHGSLLQQAKNVLDLIFTKYLKSSISYIGANRVETFPYPKDAIREAVYNAIVHKDYSKAVPIQIKIYDNRIYIYNDCIFPGNWTVNTLFKNHKSKPHNPLIANTFFRVGFIESWGRGIQKIIESCKISGNPEPEFNVSEFEFSIKITSSKISDNMSDNMSDKMSDKMSGIYKIILEYIEKYGKINNEKARELTGKSEATVRRYFSNLIKEDIIIAVGEYKEREYILKKN